MRVLDCIQALMMLLGAACFVVLVGEGLLWCLDRLDWH